MRNSLALVSACSAVVASIMIAATVGADAWSLLRTALPTPAANQPAEKLAPRLRSHPAGRVRVQVWHEELNTQKFWRNSSVARLEKPETVPWDRPLHEGRPQAPAQRQTYRTVCVRLCDGFYWPISFATTPANFQADQRKCEQSCGSPVKLYRYPNPGGQPEEMEDLRGQAYSHLKTAFLYRSEYNASCKCRADPWEEAAKQQHLDYALAAKKTVAGGSGSAAQLKYTRKARGLRDLNLGPASFASRAPGDTQ